MGASCTRPSPRKKLGKPVIYAEEVPTAVPQVTKTPGGGSSDGRPDSRHEPCRKPPAERHAERPTRHDSRHSRSHRSSKGSNGGTAEDLEGLVEDSLGPSETPPSSHADTESLYCSSVVSSPSSRCSRRKVSTCSSRRRLERGSTLVYKLRTPKTPNCGLMRPSLALSSSLFEVMQDTSTWTEDIESTGTISE
eukprot:EG_transcript_7845